MATNNSAEYTIEKVMAGDCTVTRAGVLAAGRIYATCSAQNGIDDMFAIDISSLQSRAWKNVSFRVTAETANAKEMPCPPPPKPRITKANWRRANIIIRDKIRAWCLDHPGFSITKQGPGARGVSEEAKKYLIEPSTPIVECSQEGNCLGYSIASAAARHCGYEVGANIMNAFEESSDPFRSIGSTQRFLHSLQKGLNFRKISDKQFCENKFEWLSMQCEGLFIVRIHAGNDVDHCALVDGDRQEILDSEEKKPLRLSLSALRSCVGETKEKI